MVTIRIHKYSIEGSYVGYVRDDGSVYEEHWDLGPNKIGHVAGGNIYKDSPEHRLVGYMSGNTICIGERSVGIVESTSIKSYLRGGTGGAADKYGDAHLIGAAALLLGLIEPSPIQVRRFQMRCPRCYADYDDLDFTNPIRVTCKRCGWQFEEPVV